jgi:hypothetical protein
MVFVGEVAPDSTSLMERIMIRVVGWADAMDCCRCFLMLLMLADAVTNNVCDDGLLLFLVAVGDVNCGRLMLL